MKKVKALLIIVAAVVAGIVILVGAVFLKARLEQKKMHPLVTSRLAENVYTIHDGIVNMYLVKDSDVYIAIDAGTDKIAVKEGLKQLKIDSSKVVSVLLTHTDFDHVAALSLFPKATLRFSKAEEQLINGSTTRSFGITHNKIDRTQYTLINDGETFTIGHLKVRTILTPGHTPGSMCYLINDRYLFVGDALSLKNDKVAPFNKFFNRDTDQAIQSISKIAGLSGVDYLFTAHYGYGNYNKAVKEWPKETSSK